MKINYLTLDANVDYERLPRVYVLKALEEISMKLHKRRVMVNVNDWTPRAYPTVNFSKCLPYVSVSKGGRERKGGISSRHTGFIFVKSFLFICKIKWDYRSQPIISCDARRNLPWGIHLSIDFILLRTFRYVQTIDEPTAFSFSFFFSCETGVVTRLTSFLYKNILLPRERIIFLASNRIESSFEKHSLINQVNYSIYPLETWQITPRVYPKPGKSLVNILL